MRFDECILSRYIRFGKCEVPHGQQKGSTREKWNCSDARSEGVASGVLLTGSELLRSEAEGSMLCARLLLP
jgi:hypothetical protein